MTDDLNALKAQVYDRMVLIEQCQREMAELNRRIAALQQPPPDQALPTTVDVGQEE